MFKKALAFKLKLFVAIVFILILAQLTTAYVFGFIAKKQETLQFNKLTSSPLIKVIKHEYHRGLFSSDDSAEITVNNVYISNVAKLLFKHDTESQLISNAYTIKYSTHIEHGLFAGILNGYFVPTVAYSKTTINYPEDIKKTLAQFFKTDEPLKVENLIYLNKSGFYKISSPAFLYSEAVSGVKITWGGLSFLMQYNKEFDRFKSRLAVPCFELSAPTKGEILLHNLDFSLSSKNSENMISVGKTSLTVKLLKVEWKDKLVLNFSPGDMLHMFTGINATDFLNRIDAINPSAFAFNNVTYNSDSNDENSFLTMNAKASFNSLVTNDKTYGPMNFDLSLQHIQSKSFSKMIDKLQYLSNKSDNENNDLTKDQMLSTIKTYFVPILANKPLIKLNQFTLDTDTGRIDLHGFATTNNFVPSDINDQHSFTRKLIVDLNMSVPKSVLSYIFILQMKYLLTSGNASMDEQSSKALTKVVNILLDNQVNGWVKKGYLYNNNNLLSTHLVMKDGVLYLNDKLSK